MQAEFITPSDPRWEAFLRKAPHDVYHLPSYVAFSAAQEQAEPVAFLAEDADTAMLMPMLLRRLPEALDPDGRWMDASAPYGYACPLMTGDPGPAQVAGFLEYFQISGRARGLVSAFFRLHPFLPLPREPFLDFGTLVDHGETVYVDLTQTREDMDGQMRAGHISDVYRLRREGYRVELDAWDRLDEFIRIYTQTMARHSASAFYFFGDDYFHSLRAALGDRLRLALVVTPGGTTVCGALFMEEGGFLEYHLSGTEEAFVKLGASKLLIVHMRDWAKERGDQLFHLGGGVGAQADSLFAFKKGFSRLRSSFCSFRMIVDDAAYAELTKWGRGSPERKLMERRRYFPGYRRPA